MGCCRFKGKNFMVELLFNGFCAGFEEQQKRFLGKNPSLQADFSV